MPEQRNYRFADEIEVGGPTQSAGAALAPTSPAGAAGMAVLETAVEELKGKHATQEAIGGILEQGKKLADNKQKLISTIIKPMKGLDDKPTSAGATSPAEIYANKIIFDITAKSSISQDAAIAMIVEVWPTWQMHGHTWDIFLDFIEQAATVFKNPSDVIEWSKRLFESMQDGSPVFTPEYIMSVALDAIKTKNFTKYQNLLLSLPFYKAVWSKKPIDTKDFAKSVAQIGTMMEAVRTPTEQMQLVLQNIIAQNELFTACYTFYEQMIYWVTQVNIDELKKAKQQMQLKGFDASDEFAWIVRVEARKKALRETVGNALKGLNAYNTETKKVKSHARKLFKTVLAAGASTTPAGTGGTPSSTPPVSGALQAEAEQARTDSYQLDRSMSLIDKRQEIITKNTEKIGNIIEQKSKGLTGDLGLFSSLVTSGNVVGKIDETLGLITKQRSEITIVKNLTKAWLNKHNSSKNSIIKAQADTYELNDMKYKAMEQDLGETEIGLKIQRIVLPKEIEYFELKQDYDTNIEQLKAPVSALMVNTLVTTRDNKGKLITVNKRVARPLAIKGAWETGKKIVNLLMQISRALQAGTNNSPLGQSMFKNASNYYKAAIKQEVENNKMLMDNLKDVGLGGGPVNYTPVAVGKK